MFATGKFFFQFWDRKVTFSDNIEIIVSVYYIQMTAFNAYLIHADTFAFFFFFLKARLEFYNLMNFSAVSYFTQTWKKIIITFYSNYVLLITKNSIKSC